MMDMDALLGDLRDRGIHCELQRPFDYFSDLTDADGRIVCVEHARQSPQDRRSSGVSFWLHAGSGLGFWGFGAACCWRLRTRPRW